MNASDMEQIKSIIASAVKAQSGGVSLSVETWAIVIAILSLTTGLVVALFNSTEKRINSHSEQLKGVIEAQNRINDKINESLITLNATLDVTNWRTKSLEESHQKTSIEVSSLKEQVSRLDKSHASAYMALRGTVRKEIERFNNKGDVDG